MINLNTYILEKLHLNKDLESGDVLKGKILGKIICILSFDKYDNHYKNFTITDNTRKDEMGSIILKWIEDNDVIDFNVYAQDYNLDDWKVNKKQKEFYSENNEILKKFKNIAISGAKSEYTWVDDGGADHFIYVKDECLIDIAAQNGLEPLLRVFEKK